MKDLVNYELALLAKECKYQKFKITEDIEGQFFWYDKDKKLYSGYFNNGYFNNGSRTGALTNDPVLGAVYSNACEAPTIYELQTWLREIHGLHISIDLYSWTEWFFDIIGAGEQYKNVENYPHCIYDHNPTTDKTYKTHKEALTEALFEGLKLIKNE